MKRIAAIGELLWDLLPDGPQLGGAPANFAAMSAHLEALSQTTVVPEVFLISRIGQDEMGRRALSVMRRHAVRLDHISIDPNHATGSVAVAMGAEMNPSYRIDKDAAWDFIPETDGAMAIAPVLDAICFGTLAQRCPTTRATVRKIVEATNPRCMKIFDVNLRAPFWTPQVLQWGCSHATILKMSEEEVPHVVHAVDSSAPGQSPGQAAAFLFQNFPIQMIAITRGSHGSFLATREGMQDHSGVAADAADAIGAGDAFTAALTHFALRGFPLPILAEAANRWGAWVAAQSGGMPFPDKETFREIEAAIDVRDPE